MSENPRWSFSALFIFTLICNSFLAHRDHIPLSLSSSAIHCRHQQCTILECLPFGLVHSCIVNHLSELSTLLAICEVYLPSFSMKLLSVTLNTEEIGIAIDAHFCSLPSTHDSLFFTETVINIKKAREVCLQLAPIILIQSKLSTCLENHPTSPSNNIVRAVTRNLQLIYECFSTKQSWLEATFSKVSDQYPTEAEARLKSLMSQVPALVYIRFCSLLTTAH